MSERFNYATNGVYECEAFVQHLATGQFPRLHSNRVSLIDDFSITFKVREPYNQVYPYISCRLEKKLKIRVYFKINAKIWSLCQKGSTFLEPDGEVFGPYISIQDVLNDENGYLENGALSVEYGFHVDAILDDNDIWRLNLDVKEFNSKEKTAKVIVYYQRNYYTYYSPIPLLAFHSPSFNLETKKFLLHNGIFGFCATRCLQIVNGVRIQVTEPEWFFTARIARKMNLMNVVHYCDQMLNRTCPNPEKNQYHLKDVLTLNMRHCASREIGLWKLKELLEELEKYSNEITGEMMNVIIRRLIREEF